MAKPLISVIIPVYKVEKYLDRCVESIVNQTYTNLEIILVDDGSPDNCPAMCDTWAEKDNRIKVIHKENDGLANARNSGIEICTGEYVMFIDSDDYAELDMVEFLYGLSSKYDADVSRCGFWFNYENGEEKRESDDESVRILDYDERIIELATGDYAGTAWNKLYKKEIIKSHPYKKEDGCSEDIMHNYRVYKDVSKTVFCDVPKLHYVLRRGSLTRREYTIHAFDITRAKKIIVEGEKDNYKTYQYAIKGFVISAFIVISGCYHSGKFPDERDALIKELLKYKKIIIKSSLYNTRTKLKTVLLSVSPNFYSKFFRKGK